MGPPIPLYEPIESGEDDNIFISKSYDATSHFETTTGEWSPLLRTIKMLIFADDIKNIYRRAEGHELVVEGLRDGQNFNVEE